MTLRKAVKPEFCRKGLPCLLQHTGWVSVRAGAVRLYRAGAVWIYSSTNARLTVYVCGVELPFVFRREHES